MEEEINTTLLAETDVAVFDRIAKALGNIYSGTATIEVQNESNQVITNIRKENRWSRLGKELIKEGRRNEEKNFGWQLIIDQLANNDTDALINEAIGVTINGVRELNKSIEAEFIVTKAVRTLVTAVFRTWPFGLWHDFPVWLENEIVNPEIKLKIIQVIGEELFTYESDPMSTIRKKELTTGILFVMLPEHMLEMQYSEGLMVENKNGEKVRFKGYGGAVRGWLLDICEALNSNNNKLVLSGLKALEGYINWMPYFVVQENQNLVKMIMQLLLVGLEEEIKSQAASVLLKLSLKNHTMPSDSISLVEQIIDGNGQLYNQFLGIVQNNEDDIGKQIVEFSSELVSRHILYRKNIGWVPRNFGSIIKMLMTGMNTRNVSSIETSLSGLIVIIKNIKEISKRLNIDTELQTLKSQLFVGLTWTFKVKDYSEYELDQGDDDLNEIKTMITVSIRKKILNMLQIFAENDIFRYCQDLLVHVAQTPNNDSAEIEVSLSLLELASKAIEEYILQNEESQKNVTSAKTLARDLFVKLISCDCSSDNELVKSKIAKIYTFKYLFNNDSELLLMAVNSLASFLELGEETTGLNRKGDSKKNRLLNNTISENAAGILVKLVTSDPDLYYGFYNEFMNLFFQLQSATSNSPLRAKVRMATIPLILQIKTKISDRRDYKQRVELIQKYIAPSVNQHLGLNAFLDEPSNFYNQVGLLTEDGGFVEQRKILEVQCYTLRKMVECISENSAAVVSLGDEYDFFTDVFASQTCYDLVYSILRLIRVLHSAFNPNGIAPKTFIEFLEKHVYSTDTDAVANQECRYLYNFLFSVTEHCYTSLGVLINHGTLYNTDVFAYFTHALFENISYLPLNVAKNIISKVVLSNIRPHVSLSTNKEDISTAQLRSSCIYSYLFPLLKHYKDLLLTNNCYVDTYASLPDVVVFYRSFSDLIINLLKFLNCGFIRFENFEKTILSMSQFDYSNKFSILSAPEFPTEQVNLPIALCFVNHQDMLPLLLETISVLIRFKDSSLVLKLVTQVNLNISINVPLSSMLSTSHIQRLVSFDAHNILDSLSSYFCHRFLIDLCSLLFDSYHYELIDFVYNSISDLVYTALITKRFRSLDLLPEDCDSEMFTNKYIESVGTTFLQTNMLPVSKVNDLFIYYSNSQHDQKKRRAKLKLMLSNVDGINRNNKLLQDSLSFTKIPSAASNKYNYGHASALSYNIDSILPF